MFDWLKYFGLVVLIGMAIPVLVLVVLHFVLVAVLSGAD